jgi:hypothetical protein
MAYYLVKARPMAARLPDLRERLDDGEIAKMQPFGTALEESLNHARALGDGWAIWEEEDYCHPPLAMERAAVLDDYFTDLTVERVEAGKGWAKIDHYPGLWDLNALGTRTATSAQE